MKITHCLVHSYGPMTHKLLCTFQERIRTGAGPGLLKLHALTLAARSYALLKYMLVAVVPISR